MRPVVTALLILGSIAALGSAAPAKAADPAPIAAFYGKWVGSAVAESPHSIFIGLTNRDLNVAISPRDNGFSITWTTVIHLGGEGAEPEIRRKSKSLDFVATDTPGVFKAASQPDPMSGDDYAWARIQRQTLTVYLLTIDGDGIYHLQSYARTLTGFGMDLVFASIRDSQAQRVAKGKLIKLESQ